MTHEHLISAEYEARRNIFFEPRTAPMEFRKISDTEAELHQPPAPTFLLESRTRFTLREPHYLDMHYRCRATHQMSGHGSIGLFWASYIHAPEDTAYFRGYQVK